MTAITAYSETERLLAAEAVVRGETVDPRVLASVCERYIALRESQEEIESLENENGSLEERVQELEDEVGDKDDEINDLESEVDELKERVKELEATHLNELLDEVVANHERRQKNNGSVSVGEYSSTPVAKMRALRDRVREARLAAVRATGGTP